MPHVVRNMKLQQWQPSGQQTDAARISHQHLGYLLHTPIILKKFHLLKK